GRGGELRRRAGQIVRERPQRVAEPNADLIQPRERAHRLSREDDQERGLDQRTERDHAQQYDSERRERRHLNGCLWAERWATGAATAGRAYPPARCRPKSVAS